MLNIDGNNVGMSHGDDMSNIKQYSNTLCQSFYHPTTHKVIRKLQFCFLSMKENYTQKSNINNNNNTNFTTFLFFSSSFFVLPPTFSPKTSNKAVKHSTVTSTGRREREREKRKIYMF